MVNLKGLLCKYKTMYKIRRFEESLLELFSQNKLKGTTHTSIGQEADAVAVMNHITDKDFVFSNHRCHGHFIAYSDNIKILFAEIMGKETGMCKGRGGSQHICYKHFFTNGVQGGIVPNAAGIAFAEKLKRKNRQADTGIVVVFLGDGTLGQGVVYETFNMASLYEIPILFVIEDNKYAMTTKTEDGVAGDIADRPRAFGIQTSEIETNDVEILEAEIEKAVEYVRNEGKPFCQVIHTYRLGPHSKSDDFRDPAEINFWKEKDPIKIVESKLPFNEAEAVRKEVEDEIQEAIEYAEGQKIDASADIFDEGSFFVDCSESLLNTKQIKCVESLNDGIRIAMQAIDNVLLLGEDIRDPYGGAFKVTRGLTDQFDGRILNTPISEAGFTGVSIGLGMDGLKPVVEMMFGDFITLAFDQLLNSATKFNWMYAGQMKVPILIRIPSGGGRGYGATHSQTLEKYLIGIPNLRVLAVSKLVDAGKFLYRILEDLSEPTILIENKKMYSERLLITVEGRCGVFYVEESSTQYPVYKLSLAENEKADAVIITYGASTDLAMAAAKELLVDDEILVDVIVETAISPVDYGSTQKFIGSTKNIVLLEEGTQRAGWGAEVISELSMYLLDRNYRKVAAKNCVIPSGSELEEQVLPNTDGLKQIIKAMIDN